VHVLLVIFFKFISVNAFHILKTLSAELGEGVEDGESKGGCVGDVDDSNLWNSVRLWRDPCSLCISQICDGALNHGLFCDISHGTNHRRHGEAPVSVRLALRPQYNYVACVLPPMCVYHQVLGAVL
jgi:hypothetical protein